MKRTSLGLGQANKRTRRQAFVEKMDAVVPWAERVELISPFLPQVRRGRPPFAVKVILRVHFMRQCFNLSDPAKEEALHVDATLIAAPSSTRNASGERDAKMKLSNKGEQRLVGMKGRVGVDAESGLVHEVRGTAGSVNAVTKAHALLHGEAHEAFGEAGCQSAQNRPAAKLDVRWNFAMRLGKRRALDKKRESNRSIDKLERLKAGIRGKVEHPFRVMKRQFGHVKVCYRELEKNTTQLHTLFAPSSLWMARLKLGGLQA